jgi:glucose-1-phosphate thymidylyltransferase
MKAIIPAAGVGTRLRPHTYSMPKILLNVAGKPMISYIIDELIEVRGLDTIIIIVGHLGDKVQQYISEKYAKAKHVKFEYVEQKEMLGLGHAVYMAKDYVDDEPVVIVLGDTIFEFSLADFLASKYSAIGYKEVEDARRFGVVESKDGFITRMVEKPQSPDVSPSRDAIAGLYYIKNASPLMKAIEHIMEHNVRTKNEFQLTDALEQMIKSGEKFIPFEIENWFDCGKPETMLSTNKYLLEKNKTQKKFKVSESALIIPPVFIGDNCKISNSIIGPYTTVGNGVHIKDTILKNSIIGDNSTIENSILQDSIIGSEVNVTGNFKRLFIGDSTDIEF